MIIKKHLNNNVINMTGKMRKCNLDDYNSILNIQQKVVKALEDKNIFIPTGSEDIKKFLKNEDVLFLGIDTEEGLCSYAFSFLKESFDFSLNKHFENKYKIVTFDSVVVLPEYRGNNLQRELMRKTYEECIKNKFNIITATVSPDNIYSLNNFIKEGFIINKIIYYKEIKRYLVYKYL